EDTGKYGGGLRYVTAQRCSGTASKLLSKIIKSSTKKSDIKNIKKIEYSFILLYNVITAQIHNKAKGDNSKYTVPGITDYMIDAIILGYSRFMHMARQL
ncbi:MAG: hypothetical protein PHZ09_10595, partial [Eubacteriales bacterium]|nr:hypothetical protein [Eubacteriales bacterium]